MERGWEVIAVFISFLSFFLFCFFWHVPDLVANSALFIFFLSNINNLKCAWHNELKLLLKTTLLLAGTSSRLSDNGLGTLSHTTTTAPSTCLMRPGSSATSASHQPSSYKKLPLVFDEGSVSSCFQLTFSVLVVAKFCALSHVTFFARFVPRHALPTCISTPPPPPFSHSCQPLAVLTKLDWRNVDVNLFLLPAYQLVKLHSPKVMPIFIGLSLSLSLSLSLPLSSVLFLTNRFGAISEMVIQNHHQVVFSLPSMTFNRISVKWRPVSETPHWSYYMSTLTGAWMQNLKEIRWKKIKGQSTVLYLYSVFFFPNHRSIDTI